MSHNIDHLSTAGKVTILTTFLGVVAFSLIFFFSIGEQGARHADAQDIATTTVTVLNTPPQWTNQARELYESSTTSPTNAGSVITWVATGTDANSERYYLLICKTAASPTASSTGAPRCDTGTNQWAVSASTTSGTQATAATTTQSSYAEVNAWFGWICDENDLTPRCVSYYTQGTSTPQYASPFEVNHRPLFSAFADNSPGNPGTLVTFYSTSSDTDVSGAADTVRLWVCNENDFNISTNQCGPGGTIASSTLVASNASASYTIVIPTQDQNYTAYGFVIDNHGFESAGVSQGSNAILTVNNVAPTISSSTISINGGNPLTLTVEEGETTGFTLEFVVTDNNSCENSSSNPEVEDYIVGLYRSGVGSTTCSGSNAGAYDPNDCYPSAVATTTWNLDCTASSTTCGGASDPYQTWECTFPLWYIADPTDGTATSTQYSTQNWLAVVRAIDDDAATGAAAQSATGVDVESLLAFRLDSPTIAYGSIEPGDETDPLVATTTIAATGNVGLDQRLEGESMCITYSTGNDCPTSSTSTIPESEQVFATSSVNYADGQPLSSTTVQELELNVFKTTSTSSPELGDTYWGIRIPSSITLSGDYKGENVFTAIVGESVNWGP